MDNGIDSKLAIYFDVSVVLPAGGSGERFGCHIPKQYCSLVDQPLILHTISAFHRIPWLKRIAVVVNRECLSFMDQLTLDHNLDKVTVVEGCSTRHRSIYAGIKALAKVEDVSSVVVIHDAVRPFIDEEVVRKIAVYAKTFGAAGVTRPLVSTVIAADGDGFLRESLNRNHYCASEMPQGFQMSVIKAAYEKSTDEDFDYGTECLLLAMKHTGTRAKLFTGQDNLWKVTYRKDLYAAEAILKEKSITIQIKFVACEQNKDLTEAIVSKCKRKRITVKSGTDNLNPESLVGNSVVFIYSDFTPSAISINTTCVQRQSESHSAKGSQLKPCIVHVYDGNSMEQENIFRYMETIRETATELPEITIYGVLNFNGADYTRLSDMVTCLVWNRDSSISGQTFIIHEIKDKS